MGKRVLGKPDSGNSDNSISREEQKVNGLWSNELHSIMEFSFSYHLDPHLLLYYLGFNAWVTSRRWNGKKKTNCLETKCFGLQRHMGLNESHQNDRVSLDSKLPGRKTRFP